MRCSVIHTAILLWLLYGSTGFAQNLILNPSFEEYARCPERLGNFAEDVIYWTTPTKGSTDYFNACSEAMGAPENFNGRQPSDFGNGYAGFYLYAPEDYREYIQVALAETLRKGATYELSFYVSLAERSDYAVKEFGVVFSEREISVPIKKELSRMQLYKQKNNPFNSMEIGYTNFFRDTKDWILVNTRFEAKGMENFMTIGNFKNNLRTRKFKTKRDAKQGAYYYIDAVVLEKIGSGSTASSDEQVKTPGPAAYKLNKVTVFENVLFSFDEYRLSESAKEEIQRVYRYLEENPLLMISIHGHTDTSGGLAYNQVLSENRCKAVAGYFSELGLPSHRIRWEGFGGSAPLANNASEAGRELNRRVEFVITAPKDKK